MLVISLPKIVEAIKGRLPGAFGPSIVAADEPDINSFFSPLTENQKALYDKAGELYRDAHSNPAGYDESYCVKQLTAWLADKHFSENELDTMEAVFSERWNRNNEGSARSGALGGFLCSEGHKYRWILTAIAESKSAISRSDL